MVVFSFKQLNIYLLIICYLCTFSNCESSYQYSSSKYLVPSHRISFFEAVEWCRQKSMKLVELDSYNKNNEVFEFLKNSEHWLWEVDRHFPINKRLSYWTAGYTLINDRTWRWWSDGRPMVYFNWDSTSRRNNTNHQEICMAAYNPWHSEKLMWSDYDCNSRKHFICEFSNGAIEEPLESKEKCYYVSQMKLSLYESKQFCQEQSMKLVNISSEEKENDMLRVLQDTGRSGNIFTKYEYWAIDADNEPIVISDNEYALLKEDSQTPYQNNYFVCESIEIKEEFHKKQKCNYNIENKKTYYISEEMANYNEAVESCISKGMQLLSIEDDDKNRAVHRELSRGGFQNSIEFWTSGNRLPMDSAYWQWGKGSKVRYTNWNYEEPNNSTERENCIQIFANTDTMAWNDIRCEKRMRYICESPTPSVNLFCIRSHSKDTIATEVNQIDLEVQLF